MKYPGLQFLLVTVKSQHWLTGFIPDLMTYALPRKLRHMQISPTGECVFSHRELWKYKQCQFYCFNDSRECSFLSRETKIPVPQWVICGQQLSIMGMYYKSRTSGPTQTCCIRICSLTRSPCHDTLEWKLCSRQDLLWIDNKTICGAVQIPVLRPSFNQLS